MQLFFKSDIPRHQVGGLEIGINGRAAQGELVIGILAEKRVDVAQTLASQRIEISQGISRLSQSGAERGKP